jgi:prepilin-type N-terminal cleavage/methylation domain-containing protein/prepilin-type processing-associated H-X9-DG protein
MMKRGFTLIEILVVTLVLTILISLLLAGLNSIRQASRTISCLSNQSQIGKSMMMYSTDNKDWIPREGTANPNNRKVPWAVLFRPYLNLDNPTGDLFANSPYYKDSSRLSDNHKIHYVLNAMPFLSDGTVDPRAYAYDIFRRMPIKLSRIPFPSNTLYITCFAHDDDNRLYTIWDLDNATGDEEIAQYYDIWSLDHINPNHLDNRIDPKRHGSGSNATYFDGHARFIKQEDLTNRITWNDFLVRRR